MKIRHQEVEIPIDGSDPFLNCKLDRKKYATVLTEIVTGYAEGFVLAIDNKWGAGKTTFIRMWRQELVNIGFKTLYFNAWENDFQEEVIIALLSELKELKPKTGKTFDNLLEKTATFLKKVGPAVIKGAVSKAIGDEATANIAAAVMEYTSEQVEEQLVAFNEKKKGIDDFRNILQDYVKEVDPDKPVVFFIDELDRCRPSYAVEVLEQIKHLFSVSGIVFVLSIDKVQLGNAVRGFYGSDLIEADEYLRRFIDLEYKLPRPNRKLFIEYLYDYFGFDEFLESTDRNSSREFKYDKETLNSLALLLFVQGRFNLREIERTMARIRVVLRSFTASQFVFPEILIFLSYLISRHPTVYENIKNCNYSFQELVDELDEILSPLNSQENNRKLISIYGSILVRYANEFNTVHRNSQVRLVEYEEGGDKLQIVSKIDTGNPSLLNSVMFYKNNFHVSGIELSFIINKYELTENLRS